MRRVTVNHRDERGKVEYHIYETPDQVAEDYPEAVVVGSLAEAKAGDWVVSDNGWVVPLLVITYLENKYYTRGMKKYRRNVIYSYAVYHFPKYRKCVKLDKLKVTQFNYCPSNLNGFASEGKRDRNYELSPRKLYWVALVANGYTLEKAAAIAFPGERNHNRLLKKLLNNDKLMKYLAGLYRPEIIENLNSAGLTAFNIAGYLKAMVDDPELSPKDRLGYLKLILHYLDRE